MSRAFVVCTICAVLCSSWLEKADAQVIKINARDSLNIIQAIETLSQVVKDLDTQVQLQSSVLRSLVSKEELESILLKSLATKSDMQIHETSLKNLEAQAATHGNSLSNLQATVDEIRNLLLHTNQKQDEQVASSSNVGAKANMQKVLSAKFGAKDNQTSVLTNILTDEGMQANNMTEVEAKGAAIGDEVETLPNEDLNFSKSKETVEGIIAGTSSGVVIIPFPSREPRAISSYNTYGVAFNWQSRKVYRIELRFGIKIADLDGSSAELLIADTSVLRGLAVDQITGNFYYGVKGCNPKIQVCDSRGKKCVTVASGVNLVGEYVNDIALFPSEGLMFWSSVDEKKTVTRANMDGTNATVIILEHIFGLYLDESKEKLYWANRNGQSIGQSDLNGNNRNVLLNTTIYPYDIAVDGDTLYFGGTYADGVYSVTSNRKVSAIANTTGDVHHIALYGISKVSSRPNPCENSPCENLCVMTGVSYTCL